MSTLRSLVKNSIWKIAGQISHQRPIRTHSRLLTKCCPPRHDIIFQGYLDEFSVLIDNGRFIEAQVVHAGYESWLSKLIDRFVPASGAVCLDIGANVGLISFMMAKRASADAMILAIEPSPPFFSRLQQNLALNPQVSAVIRPINCGLAEAAGQMFWVEDPDQPGNGMLTSASGIPVPVTTVTALLERHSIPRLDFVKIDVEGMEHEVLRGGDSVWRKFRPVIFFETLPTTPAQKGYPVFHSIATEFGALDYDLYSVSLQGDIAPASPSELGHNSLLLPKELAA
jgi:FkbM family methyltransferase